ncbi:hypothetical protein A2U01_0090129, partial [Trifolium medium]|nr:hypothetical protein [Trifolium medium]
PSSRASVMNPNSTVLTPTPLAYSPSPLLKLAIRSTLPPLSNLCFAPATSRMSKLGVPL